MKKFDVNIMITSDEDHTLDHDACVMVEVADDITRDELDVLCRRVAGAVQEKIKAELGTRVVGALVCT